ncbi:hypothetical protein, partial [Enterobacter kobei]|uniref:hypothetical protein n=1 Tax=Enterobacter kobei TaxID=208224 RepID=UPI003B008FF9
APAVAGTPATTASGDVAGAENVAKGYQLLIPTATAQIKESFLFIALSSLLSHCRFCRKHRRGAFGTAR